MAPTLPLEIWHHIFGHIATNRSYPFTFWINGRQVCHQWRAAIPKAYAEALLKHPKRCMLTLFVGHDVFDLAFDRYDEKDKSRCIFSEAGRDYNGWFSAPQDWEEVAQALARHFNARKNEKLLDLNRTPHLMTIYGDSADGELPDLQWDTEKREISFRWEGMLNHFSAEVTTRHKHSLSKAEGIRALLEQRTGYDPHSSAAMIDAMKAVLDQMKFSIRDIRRLRIAKRLPVSWRDASLEDIDTYSIDDEWAFSAKEAEQVRDLLSRCRRESTDQASLMETLEFVNNHIEIEAEKDRVERIMHGTGAGLDDSDEEEEESESDLREIMDDIVTDNDEGDEWSDDEDNHGI